MADSRSDSNRSGRKRRGDGRRRKAAPQDLPHFSLLADPARIAGEATAPEPRADTTEELERLRAELARRSFELQDLRRDLSLELTLRAARESEFEQLKAELETLRQQTGTPTDAGADLRRSEGELARMQAHASELARELAQSQEQSRRAREQEQALRREAERLRSQAHEREIALRETQTTLSIARQTIDSRRATRSNGVPVVADSERNQRTPGSEQIAARADTERALARALRECALRGQTVAELEAASLTLRESLEAERQEARDRERQLEATRGRVTQCAEQIEALREQLQQRERQTRQLEEEQRARNEQLEQARDELERVRRESTRLSRALSIIERTAAGHVGIDPEHSATGTEPACSVPVPPESVEADKSPGESVRPSIPRPAIFRYWRDSQIRHELARSGYAGCDDLFASEIAVQCERARGREVRALILAGRCDTTDLEGRLASRVKAMGFDAPRFDRLLLIDRASAGTNNRVERDGNPQARTLGWDDGAWRPPVRYDSIVSDEALAHWLDDVRQTERIQALLEALRAALAPEGAWVFAERLAGRAVEASSGVGRMGERIWQLMPARYKYDHVSGKPRNQFLQADFTQGEEPLVTADRRSLLELMQPHFQLERRALFGCLADAFVGPELGPNFDPEVASDRRFIDQIAGLDAAKIRAGVLAPLHLAAVARSAPGP